MYYIVINSFLLGRYSVTVHITNVYFWMIRVLSNAVLFHYTPFLSLIYLLEAPLYSTFSIGKIYSVTVHMAKVYFWKISNAVKTCLSHTPFNNHGADLCCCKTVLFNTFVVGNGELEGWGLWLPYCNLCFGIFLRPKISCHHHLYFEIFRRSTSSSCHHYWYCCFCWFSL